MNISNCEFDQNTATDSSVFKLADVDFGGLGRVILTVTNSSFTNNKAEYHSTVYVGEMTAHFINTTFQNNEVSNQGGGAISNYWSILK